MNAHAQTQSDAAQPALTVVALQNVDILRAIASGERANQAAIARAAGIAPKNIGRQLSLLSRDGLIAELGGGDRNLTDAGKRALAAIDLAEGRIDLESAGGVDAAAGEEVHILHHHLRPNPANPRQFDEVRDAQELDELAATIVAADLQVLQNLVIYPADEDGVHDIAVGERRFRAVGQLIEQGVWPRERPLRCIVRDRSPGDAAFIALVENGARTDLTMIEQARGYLALTEERGWSARNAALQTGRDPRTVQEMLKVLREAEPDDIARHEAAPQDFTWEDLRESVREAKVGVATLPEPEQGDLVEAAGGEEDGGKIKMDPPTPGDSRTCMYLPMSLTVAKSCALAELAHKSAVDKVQGNITQAAFISAAAGEDPDFKSLFRWGYISWGQTRTGDFYAHLTMAGKNWLAESQYPVGNVSQGYETPWLRTSDAADPLVVNGVRFPNLMRANEARRQLAGGTPYNSGGGRKSEENLVPTKPLSHQGPWRRSATLRPRNMAASCKSGSKSGSIGCTPRPMN